LPDRPPLQPVIREHLDALSDEVGIMQHAVGSRPDPAHGYCTDDVARALQVDLLHGRVLGWEAIADSAWREIRFLVDAFDEATGRFRNFRSVDGTWLGGIGSDDCHGRAVHALGLTIADAQDPRLVEAATGLFQRALPATHGLRALRAHASVALGCDAAVKVRSDWATNLAYRLAADRLRGAFEPRLASPWPWPESRLTYENALPVRALIVAGRHLGTPRAVDAGVTVLDWLVEAQTAPDGHLSPIGNGWWPCGGVKAQFDQQPIEAATVLLAAEAAHHATGDERHRRVMERAYGWFLGANDLGAPVVDPGRGAGFDGLTPTGVNTNQGAESTLMWLMALEHTRTAREADEAPQPRRVLELLPASP
jgi:hypothetical protein